MTAATPITMPSIVSSERILFARRAPRATAMISPRSIDQSSAAPAAASGTTAAATTTSATRVSTRTPAAGTSTARARVRVEARHAHALARAIILRLTSGLHLQSADQYDAIAFLQAALHFGVVEVALTEHQHARNEVLVGRVGCDEDETRAR